MLHTLAIILCNELPSVISEPWLHLGSGGSRGVPWVPQNSPFYRFARMRRRPRACARAQSKHSWTAEPPILSFCTHASQASWQSKHSWTAEPPFQNPRSATAWCRHSQGWRPIHLKNTSHTKVAGYRDGRFVCTLEKFMLGVCNIDVYAMICTWCCCNTAQQDFTQK